MEKKHYYGIDYLRVVACIGIVMMHMLSKDNNSYVISGFVTEKMIPSFTNFVYLFMTISAFGMCTGYYEKVMNGRINWVEFYKKRYLKVLPFFSVVVLLDIVMKHNINSIVEAIPNLTLTRGFFDNNISQVGVAWFLGLIFVFYAIFPLFCAMLNSKKSAWFFFALSLLLNYVVGNYYAIERTNIAYSMPFLLLGGLIYLYIGELSSVKGILFIPITVAVVSFYYLIGENVYTWLLVSSVLLIQALVLNIRKNNMISFLSGISLEIYLSHMVVFRGIEKLQLNYIFGNGVAQYMTTVVLVFCLSILFTLSVKCVIKKLHQWLAKKLF